MLVEYYIFHSKDRSLFPHVSLSCADICELICLLLNFNIGNLVKKEVNKLYRSLELDLDGMCSFYKLFFSLFMHGSCEMNLNSY